MLPKLIIHNSISLDCSITGFEANLELHYGILRSYGPDAMLVGSNTAKTGIELFCEEIPPEEESDFLKPEILPGDPRAFWLLADSRGTLKGLLHILRRSEYCKDVIVLVSEKTPAAYLDYLKERDYDTIRAGEAHVDYREALETANGRYGFKIVVSDSGSTLNSILLEQGLAEEISLLVSPVLVGKTGENLFGKLEKSGIELELVKNERMEGNYLNLLYRVLK